MEAWGAPTFRIKGGKIFAMYAHASDHHGGGRHSVWIKAAAENQALMRGTDCAARLLQTKLRGSGIFKSAGLKVEVSSTAIVTFTEA